MSWHLISFVKTFSPLVINDSLYSPALWKRSRAMLAFGSGLILFHNVDIAILYRLETGVHGQLCFQVPTEVDLHVKLRVR
jgi:hypothetical protein